MVSEPGKSGKKEDEYLSQLNLICYGKLESITYFTKRKVRNELS